MNGILAFLRSLAWWRDEPPVSRPPVTPPLDEDRAHVAFRDQLIAFAPDALMFSGGLFESCQRYHINTGGRRAMYLAELAHESQGFTRTEENMNYSAERLLQVFPRYFDVEQANAYARDPRRIASRVYGGRMGNGNEASGDGWKFRGRGLIQLTGKDNYWQFSTAYFGDDRLVHDPEPVSKPHLAALSAGFFWEKHGLNSCADRSDLVECTIRINGGTNGLDDRRQWYRRAQGIFA